MTLYRLSSTPPTGQGKIVTGWVEDKATVLKWIARYEKICPEHEFVIEEEEG